jgi:hypothetical protein
MKLTAKGVIFRNQNDFEGIAIAKVDTLNQLEAAMV